MVLTVPRSIPLIFSSIEVAVHVFTCVCGCPCLRIELWPSIASVYPENEVQPWLHRRTNSGWITIGICKCKINVLLTSQINKLKVAAHPPDIMNFTTAYQKKHLTSLMTLCETKAVCTIPKSKCRNTARLHAVAIMLGAVHRAIHSSSGMKPWSSSVIWLPSIIQLKLMMPLIHAQTLSLCCPVQACKHIHGQWYYNAG